MVGEDADIGSTHQLGAEDLYAMISKDISHYLLKASLISLTQVCSHFFGLLGFIRLELRVMLRVCRHPQEVEALQLVEDLETHTISRFVGLGIGDLERVHRLLEFEEVVHRDHLVRNIRNV